MNLPFFLARRLLSGKASAFSAVFIKVAILGTALSVASMILGSAFVNGFRDSLKGKLFAFMGHVHIKPYSADQANLLTATPMAKNDGMEAAINKLPAVAQISPYILSPAILRHQGAMEGIKLKGVSNTYSLPQAVQLNGRAINFSDSSYAKEIVLSTRTAKRLQLQIGQPIFLYFIEAGSIFPRIRKLQVCGLYETGMDEIDKALALCDMRLLQKINNWQPNEITGYQLDLKEHTDFSSTANTINENILSPELQASTITEMYPNLFGWLDMLRTNVAIIFIIMSLVAAVNIITALLLFSIERVSMSGILTALGMPQISLRWVFIYHALLVAIIGMALGNALAYAICIWQQKAPFIRLDRETYGMDYAAVSLYPAQVVAINLGTLLVCFLAVLLPAAILKKMEVVKAITFK